MQKVDSQNNTVVHYKQNTCYSNGGCSVSEMAYTQMSNKSCIDWWLQSPCPDKAKPQEEVKIQELQPFNFKKRNFGFSPYCPSASEF